MLYIALVLIVKKPASVDRLTFPVISTLGFASPAFSNAELHARTVLLLLLDLRCIATRLLDIILPKLCDSFLALPRKNLDFL